ncbi:aquaporin-11 isoform X3 [Hemicordylus capensis]|uniref:aquaporin-11 isoform X3 n=1 Tax=Hemicordylus capensis TaxID=884348 RepID=UPI002303B19B|nr:aquaporin-11 isoform X3 [Hemicordylus capensis]
MPKEAIFLVLGLQLATMLLATGHMILIRTLVNRREARLFLMEMTATFQLCTCNGFLLLLMDIHPQNQLIITYIYVLTTVHYILTLNENISNPACTFLYILRKGISVRLGSLKIVAQFVGAAIARLYFNGIYSLGISYQFSEPKCNPHQADFFKAFCIELVTSTMFQLAMLTSEQQQLSFRANRLAFVITSVVYTAFRGYIFQLCQ